MSAASLPVQLSNLASQVFQDHIGAVTAIILLIIITIIATNWVTKVNASRSTLAEFIKEVRDDIKKILDRLPAPPTIASQSPIRLTDYDIKKILDRLPAPPTVASQSPTRLTDLGKEIAEEIKVSDVGFGMCRSIAGPHRKPKRL